MDRSQPAAPGGGLAPAWIAALFALALVPVLIDHVLFHPDERHYVDGGLAMLQSGDWWTPRTGNGDLRLQKPVLAYWGAALGGLLLEPSPFALRILFLLAGGAVLWCGAKLAVEITSSPHAGRITALMLACQPALVLSATRSLPDVLLSLFLTISMTGFVAILVRGQATWSALLTAYLGGALAILSKGMPAAVFVGYATVYLAATQRTLVRGAWRRLALAAVACGLLGGSWFVLMFHRHGDSLWEQFLADQSASYRFAAQPLQIAWQGVLGGLILVLACALHLGPSVRPLYVRRRDVFEFCRRPAPRFLIGWILLFLGCSACINHVSLRYLLPVAVPAMALLGSLLSTLEGPLLRRNMRGLAWVSLGLPIFGATVLVLLCRQLAPLQTAAAVLATLAVIYRLQQQLRFTSLLRSTAVLTASFLTCAALLGWGTLVSSGPSFGRQLAAALEAQLGPNFAATPVTFIGEPAHAARLRVCTGGRLQVRHLFPHEAALRPSDGIVVTLDGLFDPRDGTPLAAVPCGHDDVTLAAAWSAFQAGRLPDYLSERQRAYHILRLQDPSAARIAARPENAVTQ